MSRWVCGVKVQEIGKLIGSKWLYCVMVMKTGVLFGYVNAQSVHVLGKKSCGNPSETWENVVRKDSEI